MSEFRLPRLPRSVAFVDPKTGNPSLEGQRWWQSVMEKIEAQEAIQDQALIDIQTALTNAGIALDTANALMPDIPAVTVSADHTGAVLSGQLPRNIAATRYDGSTNVTTSSAWTATTISGGATYTIGAATGIINLTALASTTVIEATSVHNSITRSRRVTINKVLSDPPPSSSSGTQYDSSITETTSAIYGAANAGILTLTAGASGNVELAAPLSMLTGSATTGSYDAYGKWQVSASGAGVWTDVDTEIISSVPTRLTPGLELYEGTIVVNQTATGLTPASDYDFRLLLRNASGTDAIYYSGTASATVV